MMATISTKSGPNAAWNAAGISATRRPRAVKRTGFRPEGARPAPHSGHPFAEPEVAARLARREQEFEDRFLRLRTILRDLAPRQFEPEFAQRATMALSAIDVEAEPWWFEAHWTRPLNMKLIHARCVIRLFAWMTRTGTERNLFDRFDGARVEDLIARWGLHAIDITPCSDGRLAGLLGPVLRLPPSIVTARRSYAGAMFSVAGAMKNWQQVELDRWRSATPNPADANSRYLKIGVYHFSSADPAYGGCAAHGNDDGKATRALLERLEQFRAGIDARHGAGECVAVLLIGVDTDTDAIRVHVPDQSGAVHPERFVDAARLHEQTRTLPRETAKDATRRAVSSCASVRHDDLETEGIRWLCGYLLKNNIAQVDAVQQRYGGPHPVAEHAEKLVVIGDPLDDVQLRNVAFQAQMESVEEGAADLAVGIGILGPLCAAQQVSTPVLILRNFDPAIPGDRAAAALAARRMARAVLAHAATSEITVEAALRPATGGALLFLDPDTDANGQNPGGMAS